MELRGAIATHVGNVREANEDRAHFGGYVAAVADGMGGHQGGEMAASIAIRQFLDIDEPIVPGGLVDLVEQANRAVFARASEPQYRGMGTTLVALTLRPSEEMVAITNVGDSRAYQLHDGKLRQISLDHSLVEDLVRQNRLTPEEALHHPKRNILTRALGISPEVDVDRFLVPAEIGDRFLLCSDGLFNEVDEDLITQLLGSEEATDAAAGRLVEQALTGPARDNITVAVVDIVADGEGGDRTSSPLEDLLDQPGPDAPPDESGPTPPADAHANGEEPPPSSGPAAAATAPVATAVAAGRRAGTEQLDEALAPLEAAPMAGAAPTHPPVLDTPTGPEPDRQSRRTLGTALGLLSAALILIGVVYVGVTRYGRGGFFVATDLTGQNVAIFEGRPGGFLWVEPTEDVVTDIPIGDLTDEGRAALDREDEFATRREAERFIDDELMPVASPDEVETLQDGVTTGGAITDPEPSTTTTTAPPGDAGAGGGGLGASAGDTGSELNAPGIGGQVGTATSAP
ncbi:MAG: protein phosphatase 2C domain-containing protein [Acidimicrobiales bacterium]